MWVGTKLMVEWKAPSWYRKLRPWFIGYQWWGSKGHNYCGLHNRVTLFGFAVYW